MKQQRQFWLPMLGVASSLAILGCASVDRSADLDRLTEQIMQASFTDKGIAKVDRLKQDENNAACSQANVTGKPLDAKVAARLEADALKAIKWPADGKFAGDWKAGEKLAQNGRGMTWNDKPGAANGGNCYNCHQISKEEISFGTLGPSLYNCGKIRGVKDLDSPESKAMLEYTWGKIWNAKAYNACSDMPRFGHNGILSEGQMRDLVALLLDPASPVNK